MDLGEIGSDMGLTVPKSYQTAVLIFTFFYLLLQRTWKIKQFLFWTILHTIHI